MLEGSWRRVATWLDSLLRHWLLAAAALVFVAALSLPQIDRYVPALDSFQTLGNTGWFVGDRFGLGDTLHSVSSKSPNHGPLYFMALNQWGFVAGRELAAGRMLSLYFGLLSLAVVYRLTRETFGALAAGCAIMLVASNVLYSHFYAYIRMYSLLGLLAAVTAWLYLRLDDRRRSPRRLEYAGFAAGCLALIATHGFGLLFYGCMALAHVLVSRKDRRWLAVAASAALALLLYAPWLLGVLLPDLTTGTDQVHDPDSVWDVALACLYAFSNGSLLLIAATFGGFALARRGMAADSKVRWLVCTLAAFALGAAMVTELTHTVSTGRMRYLIPGLLLAHVLAAAAIAGWYRRKRLIGLALLGLWMLSGVLFAASGQWDDLVGGRANSYLLPPWHEMSRDLQSRQDKPTLLVYRVAHRLLLTGTKFGLSQADYFFGRYGIDTAQTFDLPVLKRTLQGYALYEPYMWLVYQDEFVTQAEQLDIKNFLHGLGYEACETMRLARGTRVVAWRWKTLDCASPQRLASFETDAIKYDFYGADVTGSALLLRDSWRADGDAIPALQISYQLLDADWNNVAQLDLPLKREGKLRQFSIGIEAVAPGRYRLMAIVYNPATGQRYAWHDNAGWVPEMQQLAEIEIPAQRGASP